MKTRMYINKYIDVFKKFTAQDFTETQFNETLIDLGINSFNAIELMIAIEVEFNVEFPDSMITPELFATPKTLYDGLIKIINQNDKL